MAGAGSSAKHGVPSEGGRGGGGRSKSLRTEGSRRWPSDLQFMYEVGIGCMPPMVDLLDTPASRMLKPRVHKRFMRFMRATFHIFSNVNRVCIVVIFAMWAAPTEFGRVITPIMALGCFPVLFLSIMLMSAELLELLLQQHEFWFFTITNASNWIIASVLFNDSRILGCVVCFFITQLVILMDANFRTVITATRSCVLWVPAICVIITVCATRTVDIDPERFRKVIPHNKIDFTLANSFLNNNMTLMIFVVRKTFRRRHILKPEFLVNRMLPCSVLRCDLVLQRMQPSDEAGRSRYEVFQSMRESHQVDTDVEYELNVSDARSSRYRSRRSSANTQDARVFAPVTSTSRRASQQHQVANSHPVAQPAAVPTGLTAPPSFPQAQSQNRSTRQLLHVVTPTLAFLDLRNTLLSSWTPSKQLPLLLSIAHYLSGGVGLLLAAFTMYLPAAHDHNESTIQVDTMAEHQVYTLVPALSLVFTTIFFAPFLASCQRDIVKALRRNFDFMFSSFQFTIGCVCLADMLEWDYRCVALVSWVQWFHWILLWDALLPASRERFRFKKIYGTPVLVSIMLGLLWIVYSLFFSSYDALLDRTITSVDWGAFRLSIRTSTFLVGRLNTILTWSLRLVWKALRSQEDELMLIRGSLEYHTSLEIFPVLRHSAKPKDTQLVMPLEATKDFLRKAITLQHKVEDLVTSVALATEPATEECTRHLDRENGAKAKGEDHSHDEEDCDSQATAKGPKDPKIERLAPLHPEVRVIPDKNPPHQLIKNMVATGAENEDVRIVRIKGVHSPAWELYKQWSLAIKLVNPIVLTAVGPLLEVLNSENPPPEELLYPIELETNSIINHMKNFRRGQVTLSQLPDPLEDPIDSSNIHDGGVSVTTLLDVMSNPPANYPAIRSLGPGVYICDVQYRWRGTFLFVPIFRT